MLEVKIWDANAYRIQLYYTSGAEADGGCMTPKEAETLATKLREAAVGMLPWIERKRRKEARGPMS